MSVPKTTKTWMVTGRDGFDSLEFSEKEIPPLGDSEVLVKRESFRRLHLPRLLTAHSQGRLAQLPRLDHSPGTCSSIRLAPTHTDQELHTGQISLPHRGQVRARLRWRRHRRGGGKEGPALQGGRQCHYTLQCRPHWRLARPHFPPDRSRRLARRHASPVRRLQRRGPRRHAHQPELCRGFHPHLRRPDGVERAPRPAGDQGGRLGSGAGDRRCEHLRHPGTGHTATWQ